MARPPKIWWRKDRDCYYVTYKGKKERLDPDKKTASRMFYEMMGRNDPSWDGLVSDLLAAYLNWCKKNRKESTYTWYKHACDSFGSSLAESMRVRNLKPYDLTKWIDDRFPAQVEGKAKGKDEGKGEVFTDNTRHNMAGAVLRAFNWAARERIIEQSPLRGFVKAPKTPRATYFMPGEWETLLSFVPDESFKDFLTVLRHTGCRPQEARLVEARQFYPEQRCWIVPRLLAKGKKEERHILLDDAALAICKRLAAKNPEGPMFRNTRGRPWTSDAVNCRFQRLKAKLPFRATAYAARHTFITDGLVNGVGESAMVEIVGHKNKRMILDVYSHVGKRSEHLREALKKATQDLT